MIHATAKFKSYALLCACVFLCASLNAADTDGDGIEDDWELQHFQSLTACNPGQDSDGDGLTNLQEFEHQQNPRQYHLLLEPGWNLISLARIPEDNSVSNIFGNLIRQEVWKWKDHQYHTAEHLMPLKGYWVYNEGSTHLNLEILFAGETEDAIPNAFSFEPVDDALPATLVESETVTITGIAGTTPVSIENGEYRINGGLWTADNSTIVNGQTIQVRLLTTDTYETQSTTTLSVGDSDTVFTVSTVVKDTTPDAYEFEDAEDVSLNSLIISNKISIKGINARTPVQVEGDAGSAFRVNGGGIGGEDWHEPDETVLINNHDEIEVRVRSSQLSATPTSVTLIVGNYQETFIVTTSAASQP